MNDDRINGMKLYETVVTFTQDIKTIESLESFYKKNEKAQGDESIVLQVGNQAHGKHARENQKQEEIFCRCQNDMDTNDWR